MKDRGHLYADFETYSEVNIFTSGGYSYAMHPSTQVVCLAYGFDEGDIELWTPAQGDLPASVVGALGRGAWFSAHNGTFDWRIWHLIGHKQLGWPRIRPRQVLDTMALCQTFTLPGALDKATEAIGTLHKKNPRGKALIKKLCSPDKHGNQPLPWDPKYKKDFLELFQYCKDDVAAMRELVQTLPRQELLSIEQRIWELTLKMNTRGLPVAYDEVRAILRYLTAYIERETEKVPELSGGAFQKVTQVAKLVKWCNDQEYPLDNLQAATVDRALEDPACPPLVKRMLELRQELGRTSTAKFRKIADLGAEVDGYYYVHDNLVFHGAAPGRWTGKGFQMQNLPRLKVPNPDEVIAQFMAGGEIESPVQTAKALIRPVIKAPPGETLMVSDYSSIEYVLLLWAAGDLASMYNFKRGYDQYVEMGAARYGRTYEDLLEAYKADDQEAAAQRQMGKVIILGCGYGMGWETFITTALDQFGMVISEEDARLGINAYRNKYYLVKTLWDELKKAAIRAVITGEKQRYGLIEFGVFVRNGIRWLAMKLPSGKCVYYCRPTIEDHLIPRYESMGAVPTIVHWGVNPYSKKWSRLKLIPGRITENAVQGTAREVMAQGMLNVDDRMPQVKLIGTVHDEALSRVRDEYATPETLDEFNRNLCDIPWATDCPLRAVGYLSKRYKKG